MIAAARSNAPCLVEDSAMAWRDGSDGLMMVDVCKCQSWHGYTQASWLSCGKGYRNTIETNLARASKYCWYPLTHATGKDDASGNYLTCTWGQRQRANTSFRGNDVGWLVISALFGVLLRPNTGTLLQALSQAHGTFEILWISLLRKPASWLVAVCERSENRGCGGGGCRKGTKSRRAPVLSARKRSILLDYVPLGNLLTVGYRFPLGPPFWWPERPWGCIGKYNETAGEHDNDQRKSYKIPWKTDENGANARNKPWKIPWKMEETGANARRKPWRCSKHAGKILWKCRKMR